MINPWELLTFGLVFILFPHLLISVTYLPSMIMVTGVLGAVYLTMSLLQFITSIDQQISIDRTFQAAQHNATHILAHNSSTAHTLMGRRGKGADLLAPLVQKYVGDPLASVVWMGWTVWLASVIVQCISLGALLVFLLRSVIYGSTAVTLDRVRYVSNYFHVVLVLLLLLSFLMISL
jgi:hypothetical protein